MSVSVNDSFVAEKAVDYAKLCELSKAKWIWSSGQWVLADNEYRALWDEMRDKKYQVLCFKDDTQETGYSIVMQREKRFWQTGDQMDSMMLRPMRVSQLAMYPQNSFEQCSSSSHTAKVYIMSISENSMSLVIPSAAVLLKWP
jgi:hypothetical protein